MLWIPLYDQFTRENNKDTEDIYEDLDDILEDLQDHTREVGKSGCSDDKEEEVHHDTHIILQKQNKNGAAKQTLERPESDSFT